MNFPTTFVLAQAAPGGAQNGTFMLILLIVMFGFMYFTMIRPQMKRQKEHRDLISGLSKGDEVVTTGGMAGRIDEVGENFVTVEIAPNVKIKVQRSAVQQVLPKGTLKSS